MKITVERTSGQQIHHPKTALNPLPEPDLSQKPISRRKPPCRKTKTSGAGVRLKRESAKRTSRPETPLLRWKFDEAHGEDSLLEEDKPSGEVGRKCRRKARPVVSARKLGAALWRLHLPEFQIKGGDRLGLQPKGDHIEGPVHCPRVKRTHSSSTKDIDDSPRSVSGPRNRVLHKFEPSIQFSNYAMEGATKWDPVGFKASDEAKQVFSQPKQLDQRAKEKISALEAELEQATAKVTDLENEKRSSKKKLEQFLRKLSEERAAWKIREHEKIRLVMDDMKAELNRDKKYRQRLEIVNSKLVNELTDAKLSAKRYLQEYEKERKARKLIEDVCDELAKEIGEDKAEAEALKRESNRVWEEVEEERKMLQMAEVWREERVQMKLVDAKVMLEEKYTQMNMIISDLESFLNSKNKISDSDELKNVELIRQVAASVDMRDIREMTYEPPNEDDIFAVFEDVNNCAEFNKETVEPCREYSPEVKLLSKEMHTKVYTDQSDEVEEDASEWETVSHQGSSYSPDESSRNFRVLKNGPITKISEVGSKKSKNLSTISRLWRSYPSKGDNNNKTRLSNGRLLNGAIMSPDCGSGKDGYSVEDLGGEWSSSDSGKPHNRGIKGCTEWPRGAQKGSLKSRLMEARMDGQKIQLRQVLKQKI